MMTCELRRYIEQAKRRGACVSGLELARECETVDEAESRLWGMDKVWCYLYLDLPEELRERLLRGIAGPTSVYSVMAAYYHAPCYRASHARRRELLLCLNQYWAETLLLSFHKTMPACDRGVLEGFARPDWERNITMTVTDTFGPGVRPL